MTIPSQQPESWLKQAREIAARLKELAGLLFGIVINGTGHRAAGESADASAARPGEHRTAVRRGPDYLHGKTEMGTPFEAVQAAQAIHEAEQCVVKGEDEAQCPNQAAGGLRVNLYATPTIQKRYGKRVMLSLIFDLPVCLGCFPKLTPESLMTGEQWRAFSKVAQQRNSGVLADRSQTEIVLCQFDAPDYVALRNQIAKRPANDSQPAPAGPQPEGAGDGRSEVGAG